MKKKFFAALMSICICCLSACSGDNVSSGNADIYNAEEVVYDTHTVEIGSVTQIYVTSGEFDYPYSETINIDQNGVITKIFNGTEIEAGAVVCEQVVDGLDEEIEQQKIILDAAEKTYTSLKNSGASSNDIEYARINYEFEKMAYDKLIEKQDEAIIYAPYSGTIKIDSGHCYAGAHVFEGQYLATITDKSKSYLCAFAYVSEPFKNVNFGTSVTIKQGSTECTGMVVDIIAREPGTSYGGYLYVIEPEEDSGLNNYGDVDISFDVYEKKNVVVIPHSAVKQVGERTYVNVLISGSKIETDVELGVWGAGTVEVLSGLSGGEKLIINR